MQIPELATLVTIRVTFSMPAPEVQFHPAEITIPIVPAKSKTGPGAKQ
jgi:hypothetical protein